MIHKPILIKDLSLSFPYKTCFEDFNCQIPYKSRIAIIGRNGSGKSTLLKIIANYFEPSNGSVIHTPDMVMGYVPQVIEDHLKLSGGQRVNKTITNALSAHPNVLLLDEPTNHLDSLNRKRLMGMIKNYPGTLIVVSHDTDLLRYYVDTIWHIADGNIQVFSGNYDDYIHQIKLKRTSIEKQLNSLSRQKKYMHHKLLQEQTRAAKSKARGEKKVENRQWLKMVGNLKGMKAEKSQGKKLKAIDTTKDHLTDKLSSLRLPEVIVPKFSIKSSDARGQTLIQISDGSVGYLPDQPLLSRINLSISDNEYVAIIGENGSGKSTLIKAILEDESIYKTGNWSIIKQDAIGYLDQDYNTLNPEKSVLEILLEVAPDWPHAKIRIHLNNFLFRKNEEVNALVKNLSGGEKARLSLAKIAAKTPKMLILDEMTNNLDLETKTHVIQVLKAYPGAMIIISHDTDFLKEIDVKRYLKIRTDFIQVKPC